MLHCPGWVPARSLSSHGPCPCQDVRLRRTSIWPVSAGPPRSRRCICDFFLLPFGGRWFPGLRVQALRREKRGLRYQVTRRQPPAARGIPANGVRRALPLLGTMRRSGGKARDTYLQTLAVVDTLTQQRTPYPYQVRGTSSKYEDPLFRWLLLRAWLQARQGMDSSAMRVVRCCSSLR